jgi:hypothetical protein
MNVQFGTYTQKLQGKVQQIYIYIYIYNIGYNNYSCVISKKLYKENSVSYISTCFST